MGGDTPEGAVGAPTWGLNSGLQRLNASDLGFPRLFLKWGDSQEEEEEDTRRGRGSFAFWKVLSQPLHQPFSLASLGPAAPAQHLSVRPLTPEFWVQDGGNLLEETTFPHWIPRFGFCDQSPGPPPPRTVGRTRAEETDRFGWGMGEQQEACLPQRAAPSVTPG